MPQETTFEEYCCKHSLFNVTERIDNQKREHILVMSNPALAIEFWKEKRELFRQRIADKLLAAGSE